MLFGLPSYCYDMYTRVGLRVLKRLVQGVEGAEGIRELFQQNKIKSAYMALGEALLFVEGGHIQGELIYKPLYCLEQRLFAYQFGLPLESWLHLRVLVKKALEEGVCLAKTSYTRKMSDLAKPWIRTCSDKILAMIVSLRHFLGCRLICATVLEVATIVKVRRAWTSRGRSRWPRTLGETIVLRNASATSA
jgi:hypothetical protein